jgi:hypothetical protein
MARLGHGNIGDVSGQQVSDGELFSQTCEDAGAAAVPVVRPVGEFGAKFGEELLVAFDGSGDHGREKQDERQDSPRVPDSVLFCFVFDRRRNG